jgi:hypothetical protein
MKECLFGANNFDVSSGESAASDKLIDRNALLCLSICSFTKKHFHCNIQIRVDLKMHYSRMQSLLETTEGDRFELNANHNRYILGSNT